MTHAFVKTKTGYDCGVCAIAHLFKISYECAKTIAEPYFSDYNCDTWGIEKLLDKFCIPHSNIAKGDYDSIDQALISKEDIVLVIVKLKDYLRNHIYFYKDGYLYDGVGVRPEIDHHQYWRKISRCIVIPRNIYEEYVFNDLSLK